MAKKLEMDAIPDAVREVLAIFADHLAEVQFPGVSHEALATLLERVQKAQSEVDAAKQRLADAEQALTDARTTLITKAEQGLAYAKIYAYSDEALLKRLNAVPLAKGSTAKKPTKANPGKNAAAGDAKAGASGKKRKKESDPAPQPKPEDAVPSSAEVAS